MGVVRFGWAAEQLRRGICGQIKLTVMVFFPVLSVIFSAGQSSAEDSLTVERIIPELRAVRINPHPPVIDGLLDDVIWNKEKVHFITNFTQREPDEGQALSESTKVAVVYDDDALYVAFWCYDDEPEKIHQQLVRRDRHSESDLVVVRLDPYHDHQTGYQFYVNAAGVQLDTRLSNDDNADYNWDGVWDSAVKHHSWGWSAEYRIPYHCLRFTEKEEHTWGLDFARRINRKTESGRWAFTPTSDGGFTSNFGHLTGLTNISPPRHLEILPYTVSNAEFEPKSEGNPDGKHFTGNTGFDVKYALSSNIIVDATVNPDFGQVELDRPVLNLSSFETQYSEKRPFFLEGANLFDTRFDLFYSRRIGRGPGGIDDDDFLYYTNRPTATTILGAAKMTGKLPGGTSFAFLNALTQEESADYFAEVTTTDSTFVDGAWEYETIVDSVSRRGIMEPQANYSVLRLQQDVFSNSNFGALMTLANQDSRYPAATGGVDWKLSTSNNKWSTRGQVVTSRNDGEHVGFGINTSINKDAGEHFRGSIGMDIRDPYLDLNRLGFNSINDWREGWGWLQYRTQDDWWIFRNTWNNLNFYAAWNYNGDNINKGWNYNFYWEFTNNWSFGGGYNQGLQKYDQWETWDNGLWEPPNSWSWWASLDTDRRKKVSFNFNPGSGESRYGSWWANWVGVNLRPRSNLELSFGTNYFREFNRKRFVGEPLEEGEGGGPNTVFARLNKDELMLQATVSYMFNPKLSCQLSANGLISALDFHDREWYNTTTGEYTSVEDLSEVDLFFDDQNRSRLNSTFLVRWEYLPGSTLYFVWTRARSEQDDTVHDLRMQRDLNRLFSSGSENIWLIKASYWWNI